MADIRHRAALSNALAQEILAAAVQAAEGSASPPPSRWSTSPGT